MKESVPGRKLYFYLQRGFIQFFFKKNILFTAKGPGVLMADPTLYSPGEYNTRGWLDLMKARTGISLQVSCMAGRSWEVGVKSGASIQMQVL